MAVCLWTAAVSLPVQASVYGSNDYSADVYNGSNPPASSSSGSAAGSSTPTSTVTQLPSGLEVAINLQNGQVLPRSGYTITVTPLNGQGNSFAKVEIYLDGILVNTGVPSNDGTLRWFWDTAANPATKIKIIIYGSDGSSVTKEFTVSIAPKEATPAVAQPTSTNAASGVNWWLYALGALIVALILWWLIVWWRRRRRGDNSHNNFPPTA